MRFCSAIAARIAGFRDVTLNPGYLMDRIPKMRAQARVNVTTIVCDSRPLRIYCMEPSLAKETPRCTEEHYFSQFQSLVLS